MELAGPIWTRSSCVCTGSHSYK